MVDNNKEIGGRNAKYKIPVSYTHLDVYKRQARMLALQRAAYLYSLQQGVQLRLLSDVFSTMETASNTYEDQKMCIRDRVNIVYTMHLNVCLTLQSEKTQSFITVNHY